MKPRCWVGCIARVIRAELTENVGRICEVVDQAPNGRWIVRFRAPIPWLGFDGSTGQYGIVYDDIGPADDGSLLPLIPPPGSPIGDADESVPAPIPELA